MTYIHAQITSTPTCILDTHKQITEAVSSPNIYEYYDKVTSNAATICVKKIVFMVKANCFASCDYR